MNRSRKAIGSNGSNWCGTSFSTGGYKELFLAEAARDKTLTSMRRERTLISSTSGFTANVTISFDLIGGSGRK